MTISTTQNQITYTGDAVTLAFAFPYPFITTNDLKVYVAGVQVLVGFTVTGTTPFGGSGTFASGTVTFSVAPASLASVLIYCDPDQLQSTSLPPNDPFPSKTVEKMADKLTLLIQAIYRKFGNAITFPPGDQASGVLPDVANRASKLVSFDALGNVQVVAAAAGSATAFAIQLADTASVSNGDALVGVKKTATGSVGTTQHEVNERMLSAFDFMNSAQIADVVARTLTLDVTSALQAFATAGGGYLPPGSYRVSAAITLPVSCVFIGSGPAQVILSTTSATLDILRFTGSYVQVSGIQFVPTTTRSAGSFVNFNGQSNCSLSNFMITAAWRGVTVNGGSINAISFGGGIASITNTIAATGVGIYVTGNAVALNITGVVMDAPVGSQPSAGIFIDSCSDVIIDNCNIIHQGSDLQLSPGAGNVVASVWAINSFFDTAVNGLTIAPASTGAVVRCRFLGCWFSTSTAFGIQINSSGTSTIAGVYFIDPHILGNTNNGVNISGTSGTSDLAIDGGVVAGHTAASGISIPAGFSGIKITNATIGIGGGFGANVNGIAFGGAISNCVVANNNLVGNSGSAISGGTVSGGNVRISNNTGYNPQGIASITVGASPYTYTAGLTSETIMINGGTVSLVQVNGGSVFLQTNCTVKVSAGETVTVTYTVLPGMAKYRE